MEGGLVGGIFVVDGHSGLTVVVVEVSGVGVALGWGVGDSLNGDLVADDGTWVVWSMTADDVVCAPSGASRRL